MLLKMDRMISLAMAIIIAMWTPLAIPIISYIDTFGNACNDGYIDPARQRS
jgi:hypothetical protein